MYQLRLLQAKQPVLYVGGGCLDASAELREFVRLTQIPVAQTLMGLGTYDATQPLALQVGSYLCGILLVSGSPDGITNL